MIYHKGHIDFLYKGYEQRCFYDSLNDTHNLIKISVCMCMYSWDETYPIYCLHLIIRQNTLHLKQ